MEGYQEQADGSLVKIYDTGFVGVIAKQDDSGQYSIALVGHGDEIGNNTQTNLLLDKLNNILRKRALK